MNELTKKKRVPKALHYLDLSLSKVMGVYGDTGSGKTSLAYAIIERLREQEAREVFILKHPMHEKIEELGFKNLSSIEGILKLKHCILYIDEPQLNIKVYDKKSNNIIMFLNFIDKHHLRIKIFQSLRFIITGKKHGLPIIILLKIILKRSKVKWKLHTNMID